MKVWRHSIDSHMSLNYSSIVHLMMKNYIHWTTFIEEVEFFNCWWKIISSCRSIGQKILSSRYSTYFIWGWWRLKVNYIFWDRLWSLQLILLKGLFQQSSHLSLGKVFNYTELPLLTHTLWTKLGHMGKVGSQIPETNCFLKRLLKSGRDPVPVQWGGCFSCTSIFPGPGPWPCWRYNKG